MEQHIMRKIVIALAAFAAIGIALPVTSPASAATVKKVVIKHGDRHHDRGLHRGWNNTKRVTVIHRDRDHDRRSFARGHDKKVIIKSRGGDRDHD
jgi:Ni/Co efflux regulator RcnB